MIIKSEVEMKRRGFFLFIVFILSFIVLIAHLTSIVLVEGKNYNLAVLQNATKREGSLTLNYKRGLILDRNGIVLADSASKYDLIFDAKLLSDESVETQDKSINYLHEQLGFSVDELKDLLINKKTSNYLIIGEGYTYSQIKIVKEAIDNYSLIGVFYREGYERMYPYSNVASDIIGFVNSDFTGSNGIELYYDDYLKGNPGRIYGSIDEDNMLETQEVRSTNGNDVMLTIDYTIQKYIQEAIDNYFLEEEASKIHIIVMNPNNGEVLGMANYPDYDLAKPYDLSAFFTEEELSIMTNQEKSDALSQLWRNESVSDTYEPGSTFKPFVYAAALEENTSKPEDTYTCNGHLMVANRYIECWDTHGEETMEEALQNSCNVGFMHIGAALGRDLFYQYQHMFGIGSLTNIDIPGETAGREVVHTLKGLNQVELATSSFGQTFNLTPIQLITGFSAVINGGYLYEPHFMKKIYSDDLIIETAEKTLVRQVISNEVSKVTTLALGGVVNEGTGKKASIAGYEIGGKTGTAETLERDDKHYIVSFIGFAPINNPQVITLVVVDEPVGTTINSRFAAKIFVDVMEDVMPYLHIFKTEETVEAE